MCSVSGVDLNHSTYSVRRFQQSPYSGNLINQRDTRQERIRRRPSRFRKVRAVEGVGVVEILNPILHGGHVSLNWTALLQTLPKQVSRISRTNTDHSFTRRYFATLRGSACSTPTTDVRLRVLFIAGGTGWLAQPQQLCLRCEYVGGGRWPLTFDPGL